MRHALTPALLLAITLAHAQGDLCTNAVLIGPGLHTADGPSTGAGATQGNATNADWYAFETNQPGYITVNSCVDGVTDTRVIIHTGTCTNLSQLAIDDDGCPGGFPPGNSLVAGLAVVPGVTYYIEWDDRWSTDGFTWDLMLHDCPGPYPPTFSTTDSSVTVNWPAQPAGTLFSVELGPVGFTPGTGTMITGTVGVDGPPVTFTGLSEGTAYAVYLDVNCGQGMSIGPWPVTTAGNPLVPNDDCIDALPIACGDTVQGSTTDAFADAVAGCGTGIEAPGIWYSFTGVQGSATLSTCNAASYDTRINVYTGSCGNLVCVGGNDDNPLCADYTSEVTVLTDAGVTYFVLIQGYDGQTGDFTLALSCNSCAPPQDVVASPSDTQAIVYWTSANASGTFTVEHGPAGFTPGTGTVVSGTIGINGPPVTLNGLVPGTDLELYVQEDCGGGDVSSLVGPIAFTTLLDPVATNAFCNQAAAINCGDTLLGDTNEGLFAPAPTCASAAVSAPGLWYIFIGTGEDATLFTCDQASFDTRISVFEGSCGSPVCVAGNDDAVDCPGNTSSVTFFAQNGVEYLVLVHGYDGATGTFLLTLSCAPPCANIPSNDACSGATPVPTLPLGTCATPTAGTNVCAYGSPLPNPPCDPWSNIIDVWYGFNTGDTGTHVLTLEAQSAATLNMAVYTDCATPAYIDCFTEVAGPVTLSGLPLNTDLLVRVWNGGGADAGTFTLCDQAALPTAMADRERPSLGALPVPVSDVLQVTGVSAAARVADVLDLQGRLVRSTALRSSGGRAELPVAELANGTYLLRLDGGVNGSVRFVVAR
ncbi:MAG TPA: hypothetical protein PKE21_14915 [Flavobacteriales bacterium]|nr:hypothetical protein [Flavobacteriales bacterium]HMR28770.1 hypothetical protein [Flavobacteriales bacterium]